MPDEPKNYTVAEAGRKLGLDRQRIYQLIRSGLIKAEHRDVTETRLMIPEAEIERVQAERAAKTGDTSKTKV